MFPCYATGNSLFSLRNSLFRFLGNLEETLLICSLMRSCIARTGLKRQNYPVFSRKTGNTEPETGSPMTASTATGDIGTYPLAHDTEGLFDAHGRSLSLWAHHYAACEKLDGQASQSLPTRKSPWKACMRKTRNSACM